MARAMLSGGGSGLGGNTTSGTLNKFLGAPKLPAGPVPSSGTPWAAPPPAVPNPAPAPRRIASEPYPIQQQSFTTGPGIPQETISGGNFGGGSGGGAIGGGASGGGGGGVSSPMSYGQFTDDMAATDSTFMDQKSAYANALKKFIEDNDRQRGILERDAGVATEGIGRNRTNGLTGLSEDFASRGLVNSGMFRGELDKADDQYDRQETQVKTGLKNGQDDLAFRRAKYEQENGENGTNIQAARREAFARLAASQGLT